MLKSTFTRTTTNNRLQLNFHVFLSLLGPFQHSSYPEPDKWPLTRRKRYDLDVLQCDNTTEFEWRFKRQALNQSKQSKFLSKEDLTKLQQQGGSHNKAGLKMVISHMQSNGLLGHKRRDVTWNKRHTGNGGCRRKAHESWCTRKLAGWFVVSHYLTTQDRQWKVERDYTLITARH